MASLKIGKCEGTNETKESDINANVWESKPEKGDSKDEETCSSLCNCCCPDDKDYESYHKHHKHEKVKNYTYLILQYLQDCGGINKDRVKRILDAFSFEENNLLPHYKWHKDTEHFGCLINDIFFLLQASVDENSDYYKSSEIWDVIHHTLEKVTSNLPKKPKRQTFPWGQNWYQFSITYPRFVVFAALVYRHLFNEEHERLHHHLKNVVLNYLPTPRHSIGWIRGGPNSVMMAVSYVGAHLYLGDFDVNTDEMKYVLDWLTFKPVTKGEGLYHDGGFIFHSNLRAYGYIYSSLRDMRLLMTYFNIDCVELLNTVPVILEHPTIKMHFGPLFSRTSSLCSCMCGGAYGFYTMDSIKVVSCKTEKWMLQFYGQHTDWCFYEADKGNWFWSQYWTMARQFYYHDMDNELRQLQKEFRTFYPGIISFNNQAIDIKSTLATTQTFKCERAKCITVLLHGDKEAAAMYNSWYISQFNLSVTELILITQDGYSVIYKIDREINEITPCTEPIVLSVNFGKYDHQKSSSSEKSKINGKTHTFRHNSSVIHLGQNDRVFDCKCATTGKIFQCLQCEPNENNLVAFSTFHSEQTNLSVIEENKIISAPYTLVYHSDMLWLYDADNSSVSVGKYTEYPLSNLSFDETIIRQLLGPQAEIQDGSFKEGSFVIRTDYKRNYGKFIKVDDQKFKSFIENV